VEGASWPIKDSTTTSKRKRSAFADSVQFSKNEI
jgi:hypothetical protein